MFKDAFDSHTVIFQSWAMDSGELGSQYPAMCAVNKTKPSSIRFQFPCGRKMLFPVAASLLASILR